jgi:hypothetical protein
VEQPQGTLQVELQPELVLVPVLERQARPIPFAAGVPFSFSLLCLEAPSDDPLLLVPLHPRQTSLAAHSPPP